MVNHINMNAAMHTCECAWKYAFHSASQNEYEQNRPCAVVGSMHDV